MDPVTEPRPGVRPTRIAGAATLIAVLTILSRVAGFGRTMVFAWAVGDNDLGDIYLAANLIPNILFEVVAGGALASLVVPLLAASIAAGDRAGVARTTSALLSWALTLLLPLAAALALFAPQIVTALLGSDASPDQIAAGTQLLRIFAPQLPLYGIGIVLAGVLQAHRRFAWPVLAPLLSSVTVATAYASFVVVDGRGTDVAGLTTAGLLVLGVGTTLGVAVLAGCLVPPVWRLRLRIRPGWRFEAQARARVGGLAVAGAVTVAAQHLALLAVLWRGLAPGTPEGTWVLFTLAQTIFLLPWAVLAVPLATAAYPGLAEAAATGRHRRYAATLAATCRVTLLLSMLGAAALVALADPIATLLAVLMPTADLASAGRLAGGIVGFAPGLVGYGLFAVLSRALYARGDTRPAALAAAIGWAVVAASAVVFSAALPPEHRVVALTAANSVGLSVLAAALLVAVGRGAGRAALAGLARAGLVGLLAAGPAAVAGWVAGMWIPLGEPPAGAAVVGSGMLAGGVVAAVFGGVAWTLDRRDVRPLAAAARQRLGQGLTKRRAGRGAPRRTDGPDRSAGSGGGDGQGVVR